MNSEVVACPTGAGLRSVWAKKLLDEFRNPDNDVNADCSDEEMAGVAFTAENRVAEIAKYAIDASRIASNKVLHVATLLGKAVDAITDAAGDAEDARVVARYAYDAVGHLSLLMSRARARLKQLKESKVGV